MPKFGLTMHEGTIQRFFKAVGDSVKAGEPLYEVETEKVLYEVEAAAAGTLAATLFADGDTVECGVAVAVIAEAGEDLAAVQARYAKAAPPASAAPTNRAAIREASVPAAAKATGERRAASPIARKLATELGVNLDAVEGTGPGGRITREDVERAAKSAPAPAPSTPASRSPTPTASRTPMRGVRKVIAERMHQSLQASAQITITTEADVTPATELRARLTRDYDFSYTDMMIHACARALMRHPRINSRLDGAEIVAAPNANIGIAVALDEGLIVPVVREAERKSLREIAVESRALGEKARAGHLKLEDVSGGTFTITNLGTWGVDAFTPILNAGETGILGVGRIIEKPAIYRGEIARRALMWLSLTFDHRVIDGAPAAEFLRDVIEIFNYGER
ncbi:MAG TPA: dihydrolipoamide acetyltransferase family protein [Candidatus Acidoferrales bacterium]|nr:dihydrolipoamide acetyltransferase family protein [Candidatus Acidoferrales bacterium]